MNTPSLCLPFPSNSRHRPHGFFRVPAPLAASESGPESRWLSAAGGTSMLVKRQPYDFVLINVGWFCVETDIDAV